MVIKPMAFELQQFPNDRGRTDAAVVGIGTAQQLINQEKHRAPLLCEVYDLTDFG